MRELDLDFVDLNAKLLLREPFSLFENFLAEQLLKRNSKRFANYNLNLQEVVLVNFSNQIMTPSHIFYAQGPVTYLLEDAIRELPLTLRFIGTVIKPLLKLAERSSLKRALCDAYVVANSKYCAKMYEDWGIKVDGIIYPPLDCEQFKPTTSRPSSDYVLAYVGKETKYSLLRQVVDLGVKIKAFGSKALYVPKHLLKHPNIEFLRRVSDEELIDLYSNALFTLFTFTHEPFGYVPVESMACGTPVLTYDRQGPRESVIDGMTGWLANDDEELVKLALKIWREGYPPWVRSRCRERALEFDVKVIAGKWLDALKRLKDGQRVALDDLRQRLKAQSSSTSSRLELQEGSHN